MLCDVDSGRHHVQINPGLSSDFFPQLRGKKNARGGLDRRLNVECLFLGRVVVSRWEEFVQGVRNAFPG